VAYACQRFGPGLHETRLINASDRFLSPSRRPGCVVRRETSIFRTLSIRNTIDSVPGVDCKVSLPVIAVHEDSIRSNDTGPIVSEGLADNLSDPCKMRIRTEGIWRRLGSQSHVTRSQNVLARSVKIVKTGEIMSNTMLVRSYTVVNTSILSLSRVQ